MCMYNDHLARDGNIRAAQQWDHLKLKTNVPRIRLNYAAFLCMKNEQVVDIPIMLKVVTNKSAEAKSDAYLFVPSAINVPLLSVSSLLPPFRFA